MSDGRKSQSMAKTEAGGAEGTVNKLNKSPGVVIGAGRLCPAAQPT